MSKILISSVHHANWDCLKYWFKYAKDNNFPFIITGDVVGDYNFNDLAIKLNLSIVDNLIKDENNEKLRSLFNKIIEFHAKKLANYIDFYEVKTFFYMEIMSQYILVVWF